MKPTKTSEITTKHCFGLLLRELHNPNGGTRLQWVYAMPDDWADEGNWERNLGTWSRALRKAKRYGLVARGISRTWLPTAKGRELCKIMREAGVI
jgi:hypothetical protein